MLKASTLLSITLLPDYDFSASEYKESKVAESDEEESSTFVICGVEAKVDR